MLHFDRIELAGRAASNRTMSFATRLATLMLLTLSLLLQAVSAAPRVPCAHAGAQVSVVDAGAGAHAHHVHHAQPALDAAPALNPSCDCGCDCNAPCALSVAKLLSATPQLPHLARQPETSASLMAPHRPQRERQRILRPPISA